MRRQLLPSILALSLLLPLAGFINQAHANAETKSGTSYLGLKVERSQGTDVEEISRDYLLSPPRRIPPKDTSFNSKDFFNWTNEIRTGLNEKYKEGLFTTETDKKLYKDLVKIIDMVQYITGLFEGAFSTSN